MKLFVSDMDGTLLDSKKNVPHDFDEILQLMKEKDIKMALASGRSLYSIKDKVSHLDYDFIYIGENGAIIEHDNKIIYRSPLNARDLKYIVDVARKGNSASIIACTVDQAYVEFLAGHEEAIEERFPGFKKVDDVLALDEEILRISIHSFETQQNYQNIYKEALDDRYQVVLTGKDWVNVTNKNINKASALKELSNIIGVSPMDMVAFGDYDNDIEMLEYVGQGYAMANATDNLKKVATEIIESNDNNGVTKKVRDLLND